MKEIKIDELIKNLQEKKSNITNQGEVAGKQYEDIGNLRHRIEGGKEIIDVLLNEFGPKEPVAEETEKKE